MGDTFKKAQSGQRLEIPAEAYNAFIDAVRGQRARQHDVLQDAGDEFRQSTIIKVKNTTGQDLDRFGVLAFSDPILGPTDNLQQFKNRVNLNGIVPTDVSKRFCVLLEPLAAGAIGRGVVAGATPARVNVLRETDLFAEIEPGVTGNLRSALSGPANILWKEPGTGMKWAVVLLCGGGEGLVAVELASRVDTVDDFPADAYLLDGDGNTYGEKIQVWTTPVVGGVYEPADEGFRGWPRSSKARAASGT